VFGIKIGIFEGSASGVLERAQAFKAKKGELWRLPKNTTLAPLGT
jgi:hypothetical protein